MFFISEKYTIIKSQVSNILISNDFSQSGDKGYNLYKSFHFSIRYNLFVCGAIHLITDISRPHLIEGQIVLFEKTYCQPLSNMKIPYSKGRNLHQYLNFNSNMSLIHTPCSEKYLPFKISNSLLVNYVLEKFLCFNLGPFISSILLSDDVTDEVSRHQA